jgi:ADP-ribose pyrophosphatase YjhB (NUDIX family)
MKQTITAVDINGEKHEVEISDVQWRPSAYGIIVKDGRVLLCRHKRGGYDLPGGGMEIDESIEQAAVREVKEETGVNAEFEKLLDARENFFFADSFRGGEIFTYHTHLFYCKMKYLGGELSNDGFDEWEKDYVSAPEWVELDRLDEISAVGTIDWRGIVKKLVKEDE